MIEAWSLIRFLHVLGAAVWVGGQLTITTVLLPVVRNRLAGNDRADVMRKIGRRFGMITLTAFLPVQITTGIALAYHHGVTVASLARPGYGQTLLAKLIVVTLVLLAAGIHGWAQGTARARTARVFAIGSLIGSIVIVLLASALAAG